MTTSCEREILGVKVAKIKQWVNLDKNPLFVERGIDSIDRVGPVFFDAKFKNEDALPVQLKVSTVSEISPYTAAEKDRNARFILLEPIGLDMNEGTDVQLRCVAFLPPAGGAVYKVEAKAGDAVKAASDEIEAWRRLFFQVFHMHGVTVPNLGPTFDYYKTLFLDLVDVPAGATVEILAVENADQNDLVESVKPKYTVADREPFVMALVFSRALPRLASLNVGLDASSGNVSLPSRLSGNSTLNFDLIDDKFLWWRMNSIHDAMNGGQGIWLQSDVTLTVGTQSFTIPKSSVSIDLSQTYRSGQGYNRLKIALPEEARNKNIFSSKDAKIKVKLFVVDGFSGGFAVLRHNLLTVASNSWWRSTAVPDDRRLQVLNHEFGHKLGMVPKGGRPLGNPNELDAPDKLYGDIDPIYGTITAALQPQLNGKGHHGAHCERGATGRQQGSVWKWTGTPSCTMFGATSTDDAATPSKFCDPCSKLVVRQDLDFSSNGLPGFSSLLTL